MFQFVPGLNPARVGLLHPEFAETRDPVEINLGPMSGRWERDTDDDKNGDDNDENGRSESHDQDDDDDQNGHSDNDDDHLGHSNSTDDGDSDSGDVVKPRSTRDADASKSKDNFKLDLDLNPTDDILGGIFGGIGNLVKKEKDKSNSGSESKPATTETEDKKPASNSEKPDVNVDLGLGSVTATKNQEGGTDVGLNVEPGKHVIDILGQISKGIGGLANRNKRDTISAQEREELESFLSRPQGGAGGRGKQHHHHHSAALRQKMVVLYRTVLENSKLLKRIERRLDEVFEVLVRSHNTGARTATTAEKL